MADFKKTAIALNLNNIKALINEGHGVKGLSEMDLKTLPQEFIQPLEKRFNIDNTLEKYIENMVCDVAEEWGLIRLVNHGISIEIYKWHDKLTFTYVSDEEALKLWHPSCRPSLRLINCHYTSYDRRFLGSKIRSDPWIRVALINGALVINVGDALKIMSNRRYKSIEHFVTVSKNNNRISMPFFASPTPCAIIGPFEEVLESTGEEPLYKECVYSEYAAHFYSKAHRGKDKIQFVLT
ncbi:feruloyl CoA ortho-hydroxylase 2-like [Coffea eugenioides]|uniref:feruloyl CoA ortho-hydroxylase 2-like n=1 Tax=Coffea eugenioides TaxID=49369 RepID=UPI000F60C321|nr:feruloyl CoA ortho-hydroxylase 2-like [Coffea eugenioides]